MDYLQGVFFTSVAYIVVASLVTLPVSLSYVFLMKLMGEDTTLSKTVLKFWTAGVVLSILFALVSPANTPKTNLRVDPSPQQSAISRDRMEKAASVPLRQIPGPEEGDTRKKERECREAKQGYRQGVENCS